LDINMVFKVAKKFDDDTLPEKKPPCMWLCYSAEAPALMPGE